MARFSQKFKRIWNLRKKKTDSTEVNQNTSSTETVEDAIDENNTEEPLIDTYLSFMDSVVLEKELKTWLTCPACKSENVTFKKVSKTCYFVRHKEIQLNSIENSLISVLLLNSFICYLETIRLFLFTCRVVFDFA